MTTVCVPSDSLVTSRPAGALFHLEQPLLFAVFNYHLLTPGGGKGQDASRRASRSFPQNPLIEICIDDKFAKRIILASLLCGSGKVC